MEKACKNNQSLIIEAYDKDPTGVDWLGEIKPIAFAELVKDPKKSHHLDMFDKKGKKMGDVTFTTTYIFEKPDPPKVKRDENAKPLNKKCKLDVYVVDATFLKDADTFGK